MRMFLRLAIFMGILCSSIAGADPYPSRRMAPLKSGEFTVLPFTQATMTVFPPPAGSETPSSALLQWGESGQLLGGEIGTDGRTWSGYWVHDSGQNLGLRRCGSRFPYYARIRGYRVTGNRYFYWGRFSGQISADGERFTVTLASCDDNADFDLNSRTNLSGRRRPLEMYQPSIVSPATPPDGPCASWRATAYMVLSQCYYRSWGGGFPLRIRMVRDLEPGLFVQILNFTPISKEEVDNYLNGRNTSESILRQGGDSDVGVWRGNFDINSAGETIEYILPFGACKHDYMLVNAYVRPAGSRYDINNPLVGWKRVGLIQMGCGPKALAPDTRLNP